MIFFTANTHFGHTNIIRFCNRPFKDIEEMDEKIITNWNDIITPEDTVYHLGDFAWRNIPKYTERLNGFIHLIKGSHDKQIGNHSILFTSISDLLKIVIEGQVIILCHYAMRTWQASHFNSWHLYGHSHGKLEPLGKSWDVGVDNNNFYPLSFGIIRKIMMNREDNFNLIKEKK